MKLRVRYLKDRDEFIVENQVDFFGLFRVPFWWVNIYNVSSKHERYSSTNSYDNYEAAEASAVNMLNEYTVNSEKKNKKAEKYKTTEISKATKPELFL